MHKEVLDKKQTQLLALLRQFAKDFGLVGGTAIALYVGHRQSIDFYLFSNRPLNHAGIRRAITRTHAIEKVLIDDKDEYTVVVNGVKITFLYYPFPIRFTKRLDNGIKLPNLLTLAAMKAYALGRRAKWKDYVDLYFIMQRHSIMAIIKTAQKKFGNEFNEKNFRAQLSYFKDIDYTEKIIPLKGRRVSNTIIKKTLSQLSISK